MIKLNLVIADIDEAYTKGLSGYVSSYHPAAFTISCFTKPESFIRYMEQQPSVDVLIAGPEFCEASADFSNIRLKAVLSESKLNQEHPGFQIINRFNTGEKLIGEVIHLYSKLDAPEIRSAASMKDTRLVGVYSPAGGTGKTTIAAALSFQCNELGMKAFYLNLESIQSGSIFFNSNNKRGLSYVFYYLKEKSNNLSIRMEGIKSTDIDSGVDYFSPPESPLEYSEIDVRELEQLIGGIKGMGYYDYIFVDMSSTFDTKNYRILSLSDQVVLITLEEPASLLKKRALLNELSKLKDTGTEAVPDKLITVINRHKAKGGEALDEQLPDTAASVVIPEYTRVLVKEDAKLAIDDDDFRKAVNQLMNLIAGK